MMNLKYANFDATDERTCDTSMWGCFLFLPFFGLPFPQRFMLPVAQQLSMIKFSAFRTAISQRLESMV